jgi:hypothetical protein
VLDRASAISCGSDAVTCPVTGRIINNLWIHQWVILQFVNPLFSVPTHHDLSGVGPDGFRQFQFKHKNWMQFIRSMDDELELEHQDHFNEIPHFGLVWLGQCVDE